MPNSIHNRFLWLAAAFLALSGALAFAGPPDDKPAEAILIRGGTLLTGSHGKVEGDLLLADGKIAQVGGAIVPPMGARIIEAKGRFVTPGVIDVHSHMGVYPWTVAQTGNSDGNEATSPITPDVRAEDSIYLDDPAFERARAGGVTTALILPGSANLIGGEGVVIKLRPDASLEGLRFQGAPRQLKMAMGENPKRVYGSRNLFPSTRMGNFALLREAFRAARDYPDEFFFHEPFRPWQKKVLRDVLASGDLPPYRSPEKIRLQVHCYTRADLQGLFKVADEFGLQIAAVHHGLEAYKVRDELARRKIGLATFADWWGFKQEAWDAIPENAGLCAKAGVKVAIHSDSADHIQRLWHEAAKCVAHGMDMEDALKAISIWPAEILGVADRTGSLDAGKDADVAIFSRHPFDVLTRVDATIIDGKVVFERKDRVAPSAPTPTPVVAIMNARIVPVSRPPIERGVIVLRGGRIEAVGGLETPVPADARRIDATGKTVVPGLIDSNTHVGLVEVGSDGATQDDDESSGTATPHVRVTDGINPASETVYESRMAGVTTVVVAPNEANLISGLAAVVDLDGATVCDMVVKDPAAMWADLGEGAVGRGRGKGSYTSRMGMIAQLRDLLVEAQEHRRKLERFRLESERFEREKTRRAKRAADRAAGKITTATAGKDEDEEPPLPPEPPGRRLKVEALIAVLEGKTPFVVAAHREQDIRAAIAIAEEFGLRLVLNHATEGYKLASVLAEKKIPVLVGPVTTQPSSYETWGAIYENAAFLQAAGVKIAIQHGGAHNVRLLAYDAGIAASYGLPPEAALRAITLGPAEIYGIDKDYGSLDAGKVANLVLLDGDPLQPLSKVERVFIRGREVPRASHQRSLLDKWSSPPAGGK